ncbi:MAG: P-loop NTPase [Candidatus Syntropharchaeales archaeon]
MDPRLNIVDRRLSGIKRLIAVSGGKGGIGKSLNAAVLALTLAKSGYKVGLLDLDLSSPSAHLILGAEIAPPEEDKGILPGTIHGLSFMSIVYFTGNKPLPLRGVDISNSMLELLANTIWGELDFLIIDMPPGIGDAMMDLIRWMKRPEFLIVATPSILAFETVKKIIDLLQELDLPIIGVIENMKRDERSIVGMLEVDIPIIGEMPFFEDVEDFIGDPDGLLKSGFGKRMDEIVKRCQGCEPL